MSNTNPKTGIRYGVISGNNLDPEVFNHLLYYAGDDRTYQEASREATLAFGKEWDDFLEEAEIAAAETDSGMTDSEREHFISEWFGNKDIVDFRDDYIEIKMQRWSDHYECDEPHIVGEYEGVKYQITWLGGAPLVWSLEGPTGYANRLCSPCVPNAADLDSGFISSDGITSEDAHNTMLEGYHCYVIPADWVWKEN